jgi:hypothetical protein
VKASVHKSILSIDNTANPILMPCSNKTDILVSQQIKDKIWNFEYTDFAQLIRQNGQYYNIIEKKIVLENGKLVISNRSFKLVTIKIHLYAPKTLYGFELHVTLIVYHTDKYAQQLHP